MKTLIYVVFVSSLISVGPGAYDDLDLIGKRWSVLTNRNFAGKILGIVSNRMVALEVFFGQDIISKELANSDWIPASLHDSGWKLDGKPTIFITILHGSDDDYDGKPDSVIFARNVTIASNSNIVERYISEFDSSVPRSKATILVDAIARKGNVKKRIHFCRSYKLEKDPNIGIVWVEKTREGK